LGWGGNRRQVLTKGETVRIISINQRLIWGGGGGTGGRRAPESEILLL